MNSSEVIDLLQANQNERGIQNWEKLNSSAEGLKSYGIGLTVLRKLSKKIGRDHSLAQHFAKSASTIQNYTPSNR